MKNKVIIIVLIVAGAFLSLNSIAQQWVPLNGDTLPSNRTGAGLMF